MFSVIVDNGGGREKEKKKKQKKKNKKQISEELPSIHARHTVTAVWEVVFPSESGKMMSSPVGLLLFLLFLFHIYIYIEIRYSNHVPSSLKMSLCVCVGIEKILFFLSLLVSSGRFLLSNATSTSVKNCL